MNYLLLFVPLLAIVLINFLPKGSRTGAGFWVGLTLFAAQMLVAVFSALNQFTLTKVDSVLGFNLLIDNFGLILCFLVAMSAAAALCLAYSTFKNDGEKFNFVNLLLVSLIGINGLAMARDMFSLYIFIEITAVSTFIMIALKKDRPGLEGVLKYLILSVVASSLMLSAVALYVLYAGGVSFEEIARAGGSSLSQLATVLFLGGLFIKAGLVPFNGWVPDAYTGSPAAVSAFLAGIVTKSAGVFTLIRFLNMVPIFGSAVGSILLFVGALSIVVGALAALGQKDIKRLLSYSSISQMGYIVIALGTGTPIGLFAAVFHFINHAIFKTQLFANAAAIEEQVGTRDMDKMGGLAQRMPVTGTTAAIAALATAGIPPLSGFWSKLLIIIALWLAGYYTYAVIAILASVITLAYFLSMQRRVFFGQVPAELKGVTEAGAGIIVPSIILSAMIVVIGLIFPFFMNLFMRQ